MIIARLIASLSITVFFACAACATEFHRFTHEGRTLEYALELPDRYDGSKAYPVLLALPPGDQSKEMVEAGLTSYWKAEGKKRGWVILSPAAPEGENFYSGAQTLLPDLLDAVSKSVAIEGGKVHLAGMSNGGVSAYRLISQYPDRFRSLTVLPGYPPDDQAQSVLARLRKIPVTAFVGAEDAAWKRRSSLAKRTMDRLGVTNALVIVPGSGHVIALAPAQLFDLLDSRRPQKKAEQASH